MPTQEGPNGLKFDFNDGCRVMFPEGAHPWKVRLKDLDTGNILFETELKSGRVNSTKRYYVRFQLEVWQQGESVLTHLRMARVVTSLDMQPGSQWLFRLDQINTPAGRIADRDRKSVV